MLPHPRSNTIQEEAFKQTKNSQKRMRSILTVGIITKLWQPIATQCSKLLNMIQKWKNRKLQNKLKKKNQKIQLTFLRISIIKNQRKDRKLKKKDHRSLKSSMPKNIQKKQPKQPKSLKINHHHPTKKSSLTMKTQLQKKQKRQLLLLLLIGFMDLLIRITQMTPLRKSKLFLKKKLFLIRLILILVKKTKKMTRSQKKKNLKKIKQKKLKNSNQKKLNNLKKQKIKKQKAKMMIKKQKKANQMKRLQDIMIRVILRDKRRKILIT